MLSKQCLVWISFCSSSNLNLNGHELRKAQVWTSSKIWKQKTKGMMGAYVWVIPQKCNMSFSLPLGAHLGKSTAMDNFGNLKGAATSWWDPIDFLKKLSRRSHEWWQCCSKEYYHAGVQDWQVFWLGSVSEALTSFEVSWRQDEC